MDPIRIAALVAFIVLAGIVLYVVMRSRTVGRESRDSLAFRQAVGSLFPEVDATLLSALSVVDEVRRHRLAAVDALPTIDRTLQAVHEHAAMVRALAATPAEAGHKARLADDVARAERALDRIEHGVRTLADATVRIGDVEGQTVVRRGYLELQHARDAFARDAGLAAAAPAVPVRGT
jgi:hypothetical protein